MSLPVSLKEEIMFSKEDFCQSIDLLKGVLHASCQRAAIQNYWFPCWNKEENIAIIRPNNIFWLYFWAETGQGSDLAAKEARLVFYEIFGSKGPYGTKEPDYENFFYIFDKALEMTGLPFRVGATGDPKNNSVRDALRPINCTSRCIDIFKRVMDNIDNIKITSINSTNLKPILAERSQKDKKLLETKISELYEKISIPFDINHTKFNLVKVKHGIDL